MNVREQKQAIERARLARASAADVREALVQSSDDLKVLVPGVQGDRAVVLPRVAVELLVEVLDSLGEGRDPTVVPMAKELSTGEVAALLGVSRQYAVRLLDDGRLPYRRVGNRRRVQLRDAVAYLRQDNRRRTEALREVADSAVS